jgi:predicted AlkP superfamily phosphohydrolase/phosphomutase
VDWLGANHATHKPSWLPDEESTLKLLVIGIDGADRRVMEAMDMPILKSFLTDGICLEVEEDLWSRGWAEILGGVHGRQSGGFYNKPKLDGSHDMTQSFGTKDYSRNEKIKPLWERLSELHQSVGFMNVPTTMPAPRVDSGFFVSGAGGGMGKLDLGEVPAAACHPTEAVAALSELEYIVDIRFRSCGIREVDTFFASLGKMQEARTRAYISLCRQYRPSLGFVAFMATSRVQNLAFSEIEALGGNEGIPTNQIQRRIRDLYGNLDEQIGALLAELQPRHVMIVSDHGTEAYRHSANVNALLREMGLYSEAKRAAIPRRVVNRARKLISGRVKHVINKALPGVSGAVSGYAGSPVDWDTSEAFGARYVSGIYINDHRRFGGPVADGPDVRALAQDICDAVNATTEAKEFDLRARPYRERHTGAAFFDLLPDVWIDKPDSVFFEGKGAFVAPNEDYGPIDSLYNINRDMYTGIKRRYPLVAIDREMTRYIPELQPSDLTLVYRIIENVMRA